MRKLAKFLEELPPEEFDFDIIKCGTVACAIGWTPRVFPRLVKWHPRWYPGGLEASGRTVGVVRGFMGVATHLFGISSFNADRLFSSYPGYGNRIHESIPLLGGDATPKQVAAGLRMFLELARQKKINP
jgi:hypothetical protein